MHRFLVVLLLILYGSAPATGASWTTNSFRTVSGDLVQRGDTMAEVLRSAGAPLHERVLSLGVTLGGLSGLARVQWTYRGSDGYYVVTFAGDKVEQIEVIANR